MTVSKASGESTLEQGGFFLNGRGTGWQQDHQSKLLHESCRETPELYVSAAAHAAAVSFHLRPSFSPLQRIFETHCAVANCYCSTLRNGL